MSAVSASSQYKKVIGEYGIVERIGVGSFAQVYKGVHMPTGRLVAIKGLDRGKMSKKLLENLDSEISIMKSLTHDNIVKLYEVLKTKQNIYLVLEYCNGGDLSKLLKKHGKLREKVAKSFVQQLARGLQYCRARNLIHRDLKPQNLLLTQSRDGGLPTLKIADFGFARYIGPQSMAETLCGSPLYMAPEILSFQKYDAKADLWSVGAILYEMVCGRPPFNGENHVQLLKEINSTSLHWPSNANLSATTMDLIAHLLRKNPIERISFEEFFMHPFLKNGSSTPIAIRHGHASSDGLSTSQPNADGDANRSRASSGNSAVSDGMAGGNAASFGALVLSPATPGSLPTGLGSFGTSPPFRGPSSIGSVGKQPKTNPFKDMSPHSNNTPSPATVVVHAQPGNMVHVSGFTLPDTQGSTSTALTPLPSGSASSSSTRRSPPLLQASSIEQLAVEQIPAAIKRLGQRATAIAALAKREQKHGEASSAVMLYIKALEFLEECIAHTRKLAPTPVLEQASKELSDLFDEYLLLADEAEKAIADGQSSNTSTSSPVTPEVLIYRKAMELGMKAGTDELLGSFAACNRHYTWALLLLETLASDDQLPEQDKQVLNHYIGVLMTRMSELRRSVALTSSATACHPGSGGASLHRSSSSSSTGADHI
eukprot:TRINITY_DN1918_c0_g1_i3.p1 TRINITY_DN1918_c0_g1~~TRINITY_DN1918_c0_g1_i3.p1  ORF type:complete len:654 (-),score=71.25 TRINITY_DN1918_c0_g1_i3:12-1973(-)